MELGSLVIAAALESPVVYSLGLLSIDCRFSR